MKRLGMVAVVGMIAFAGCSGDDVTPAAPSGPELAPEAVAQIEALIAEKAARSPAQRKISSSLLYAQSDRFAKGISKVKGEGGKLESMLRFDDTGRVLVDIKGDLDAARVGAVGGTVVTASAAHRSVRAWVQLAALESLAADPGVVAIRPAFAATTDRANPPRGGAKFAALSREQRIAKLQQAITARGQKPPRLAEKTTGAIKNVGSVTSEGSSAHFAERARKYYNVDGSGVKIGVLSDSDDFAEEAIASGDLPASLVTIPGQDGRPGSGEGTAMLEIIHDVAPGAQLYFATAFNSPESFADNIRRLRFEYGCDIIVDDILYYFESPYQDDIIAQAVNDVTRDGAMYFSSAGNSGNFDDGTSGTWEGDFNAEGTLATLPSGYTVHDFGDRVISNRVEYDGGPLSLHWSDPGTLDAPASSNDYDLFVLDGSLREVVVAATDVQDGTGLPWEYLGYVIPAGFRVVIARHPGAKTRALHLFLGQGGELGLSTPGTSYGHNSARDAFAVAAVDAADAIEGSFAAGPLTPVEIFSSDGPRRVFYDESGRPLRGGVTFGSGGGQVRNKPEIAGADGVHTTLPAGSGLNPFFGTSAAAPHVAAIAGLMKSAQPHAPGWLIRVMLLTGALDIEARGWDRNSGAGVASAMNSLRDIGARPQVYLEVGAIDAEGAVLPGGTTSLTVAVANQGGATATRPTATLSSSSPYVTITAGTAAYPDLASGASATNTTPLTFSVSPETPCGATLELQVTVNSGGRGAAPRSVTFTLPVGAPAPAAHFAYAGAPTAIPDGDELGVDLPVDVTADGAISSVRFNIDGTECSAAVGSTTVGVDHTWVGDLVFTLTSPSGRSVAVIDQAGGALNGGNNFCQTVLDDAGTTSIQSVTSAQAPYTGTYAPANPLAAFAGENGLGTWTLNVVDTFDADSGSVRAFSLDVAGYVCE
jgi:subtilisin-like proprotein convertase family protein